MGKSQLYLRNRKEAELPGAGYGRWIGGCTGVNLGRLGSNVDRVSCEKRWWLGGAAIAVSKVRYL